MSATNRKIDPNADPATDPAMNALRPASRLQSIMAELREENPIGKPDRPHPPITDLRSATSFDIPQEVQQDTATKTPEQAVEAVAPVQLMAETTLASSGNAPAVEKNIQPAAQTIQHEKTQQTAELETPKPGALSQNSAPVNDAALHADNPQPAPRLRGRPRVSEERKRESSYTLSPHIADFVRDLAAHEQIRLKRTISASAIVEAMIEIAKHHITDNKVLTR